MGRTYKVELRLTKKQIEIHRKTEGVCRFLYNKFLHMNYKMYKLKGKKLTNYTFNKYVNNYLTKICPWILDVPSKSRQNATEIAYNNFYNSLKGKDENLNLEKRKI